MEFLVNETERRTVTFLAELIRLPLYEFAEDFSIVRGNQENISTLL